MKPNTTLKSTLFSIIKGWVIVFWSFITISTVLGQSTPISGVINSYVGVTGIGVNNVTVISSAGFLPGNKVLLIQMKGAGINNSNNINYGSVSNYNDAGNYEMAIISSISGNTIFFTSPLLRSYTVSGIIQLIHVPVYNNATITSTLSCQNWNGTTGGVLVFEVNGNLTFNSDIDVSGKGFRGGNPQSGNWSCAGDTANYVMAAPSLYHGEKGEGIYLQTSLQMLGRGRNANGGGGGNDLNGGGGGGGNFGSGGRAGNMMTPLTCPPSVPMQCGGIGGQGNAYSNVANKVFMGGGGGTGSQNNNTSPVGGHGGGIIIIRACSISTNNKSIFAYGLDVPTFYCIDGHGGGGGGGAVLLDYGSLTGGLNVSVNGGKGGSDTYGGGDCHSKGGGGGGGIVWVNNSLAGITSTLSGGLPGIFLAPSSPCYNTSYGAAAGTSGGTLTGLIIPGSSNLSNSISVFGSSTICAGNSATLSVSNGTTYTWTPSSSNSSSIIVSPSVTTTYTVTSGNTVGCISVGIATVTVMNPPPLIVNVNSNTICLGQSATLSASGATSYTWLPSGSNSSSIMVSPTANSNFTLNSITSGCNISQIVSVTVNPIPNISIQSSSTLLCAGSTATLSALGAASYTWNPSGSTGSTTIVSPLSSMIYTVTGTSTQGCTGTATIALNTIQLPVPVAMNNSPICEGQNLNFFGNNGTTYSWYGPSGFNSTLQNPVLLNTSQSNSGNYTLTVADSNGCVSSTVTTVNIYSQPSITVSAGPACINSNINLYSSGGITYSWTGPNGFASTQSNPVINNAGFSASGQYTVEVTGIGNCSSTAVLDIFVHPNPVPQILTDTLVCMNELLTLSTPGSYNCSWLGPNGFSAAGQTITISMNSQAMAGIYQLQVIDLNGCVGKSTVNIHIFPVNNLQITGTQLEGCVPFCPTLSVSVGPDINIVEWFIGSGNNAIETGTVFSTCFNNEGTISLTAQAIDTNGCRAIANSSILIYPKPVAEFYYTPVKPVINLDQGVHFYDASYGGNIIGWNWYFFNTTQNTSIQQNPICSYAEPGVYAVVLVVKNDKGCLDTIVKTITIEDDFVLYVPNAFTPNNDGLNDVFIPKGTGILKYEMEIFDRWGTKIFHSNILQNGWEGKYGSDGNILKDGVYTWRIHVTGSDGKAHELNGHVTLIK